MPHLLRPRPRLTPPPLPPYVFRGGSLPSGSDNIRFAFRGTLGSVETLTIYLDTIVVDYAAGSNPSVLDYDHSQADEANTFFSVLFSDPVLASSVVASLNCSSTGMRELTPKPQRTIGDEVEFDFEVPFDRFDSCDLAVTAGVDLGGDPLVPYYDSFDIYDYVVPTLINLTLAGGVISGPGLELTLTFSEPVNVSDPAKADVYCFNPSVESFNFAVVESLADPTQVRLANLTYSPGDRRVCRLEISSGLVRSLLDNDINPDVDEGAEFEDYPIVLAGDASAVVSFYPYVEDFESTGTSGTCDISTTLPDGWTSILQPFGMHFVVRNCTGHLAKGRVPDTKRGLGGGGVGR